MFDHNLYITYNILCYVYIIKYHDINEIILIKLLYFITGSNIYYTIYHVGLIYVIYKFYRDIIQKII